MPELDQLIEQFAADFLMAIAAKKLSGNTLPVPYRGIFEAIADWEEQKPSTSPPRPAEVSAAHTEKSSTLE